MSHKNLKYVKPEQPSFIRKFKEKSGMKPQASVEDKYAEYTENCNDEEKEDEKPVIVVLDKSVTAEEVKKFSNEGSDDTDGKIVFRKPIKRTHDSDLTATTKKSKSSKESKHSNEDKPKHKSEVKTPKEKKSKKEKKKSSLLSFDEDDN